MPGSAPKSRAARYIRKLSRSATADSGLESVETASDALSPDRAEEALDLAIRSIERESGAKVDPAMRARLQKLLLEDGKRAMERLGDEGFEAQLLPREEDALEAIVEVNGSRPTLAVSPNDTVDYDDEMLKQWRESTKQFSAQISTVAAAVGRVDLNGKHQGTGFVIKPGLILTNRHVLQVLARLNRAGDWEFQGEPSITFDANPSSSRTRQFKIRKKVVRCGPQAIDPNHLDPTKLDFAVLECEVPAGGPGFPAPLSLESDANRITESRQIFAIGYPAAPAAGVYDDDLLTQLFKHRYGVKRFSPGEIDRGFGTAADGTGETVFTHDATTLGGNSGSCVVDFAIDGQLVAGLHFAGAPKKQNFAHGNARLHPTFEGLGLTWKDQIP
jgi:hypothetical protein